MPAIRFNRLLWGLVGALALLFAVLEPQPTRGLSLPAALGFWALHIGVGMLLAVQATEWLSRRAWAANWNPWLLVLAGGCAGSALFAPFALAVDTLLPLATVGGPPDDLLDRWEAGGGPLALLAEWLQLSPPYLASWLLVNAVPLATTPSLHAAAPPAVALDEGVASMASTLPPAMPAADVPPAPTPADGTDDHGAVARPAARPAAEATGETPVRSAFLGQLPPAIGTDLVAIQADLHYLQVRTTRGRATVLASIAGAEAALGDDGLRVHRSHWVALKHVARLARTPRGTFLTLSDGSRVPVSRRRVGEVQARLGRDFVVDPN